MSSCFGRSKKRADDEEALLPDYNDETQLTRRLHQKMHSYQMIRALGQGYMPSNEQTIINLRTLLASDVLNPTDAELSSSGRRLVKFTKQWLHQFIELLNDKNGGDQIQDFIWYMSKARLNVDATDIAATASKVKVRADTQAAFESVRTVGSLLLTNSDFRLFLGDLESVGRQVMADAALSLSKGAEEASKELNVAAEGQNLLEASGADTGAPPTTEDLGHEAADVTKIVGKTLDQAKQGAVASAKENLSGAERETLLNRLKQAVLKLRQRNDYTESVSVIGLLIRRYAKAYSRAIDDTISTVQDDVETNPELDRAMKNFWSFLSSFGEAKEWKALEKSFDKVMSHAQKDPDFESLMNQVGKAIQDMFTDPNFFEHAGEKLDELNEKSQEVGGETSLRDDINEFLDHARRALQSVLNDEQIHNLLDTTFTLASILSPVGATTNTDLLNDSFNIFIPLLIQMIQYIPIPRLEISVPEADILLENLVIEPGKTVNHTSFLPYKLRIETYNDVEIRKARFRTTTAASSRTTVKIQGLSFRAEEIGFWLRAHTGILRLADEGIASMALDERGIDVALDIEVARTNVDQILTLKGVDVKVHKLNYNLRRSKFSWLAWIFSPLLRPLLRKILEKQLANAISDGLHALNREAIFLRERIRATRIANPDDLRTFFKAILARWTPEEDPDVYAAVGVTPSKNEIFRDVYAPGSVVKLWEEEGRRAKEIVEDEAAGKWRNEIFDVSVVAM